MSNTKLTKEEKQAELIKHRALVIAAIDYQLEDKTQHIKTADFDSAQYLESLKGTTEEHFQKGRLSTLKQWFRDMSEMHIECRNLAFNKYLNDKTNYEIDIFKSFNQRINKVIAKGKITSDNQFYDVGILVDQLSQTEPLDMERIETLNKLLVNYEFRKASKSKTPTD